MKPRSQQSDLKDPSPIEIIDQDKPHLTVPNQALTIREIIERFTSGEKVDGREVRYQIFDEIPDEIAVELEEGDDNPDELTANQELYEKIKENANRKKIEQQKIEKQKTENKEPDAATLL